MSDRDDRTDDSEARDDRDDRVDDAEAREDRPDERVSEGGDDGDGSRRGDDGSGQDDDDDGVISPGVAVIVSALVGLAAAVVAYWWVGGWAGNEVFFEELYRVQPTVEGGGVGADWVVGNTVPWLDALIAIVHAADVLMGVFILIMVFLHWAIFRRLAERMQQPAERPTRETVATDGSGVDDARGGDRP